MFDAFVLAFAAVLALVALFGLWLAMRSSRRPSLTTRSQPAQAHCALCGGPIPSPVPNDGAHPECALRAVPDATVPFTEGESHASGR